MKGKWYFLRIYSCRCVGDGIGRSGKPKRGGGKCFKQFNSATYHLQISTQVIFFIASTFKEQALFPFIFCKQPLITTHFSTFYYTIYLIFFFKKKYIKSYTFYITSFTIQIKKLPQNKFFHFSILFFYFFILINYLLFF